MKNNAYRWCNVHETETVNNGHIVTITHETCPACEVTTSFKGTKKCIHDNFCPNCGTRLKPLTEVGDVHG